MSEEQELPTHVEEEFEVRTDCKESDQEFHKQSSEQIEISERQVCVDSEQNSESTNYDMKVGTRSENLDNVSSELNTKLTNCENKLVNDSEILSTVDLSETCTTTAELSDTINNSKTREVSEVIVNSDANIDLNSEHLVEISSELLDSKNTNTPESKQVGNSPTLYSKEETFSDDKITESEDKKRKNNSESKMLNPKRRKVNNVSKLSPPKFYYHCSHCPRYFKSQQMFNVHLKIEHSEIIETGSVSRNASLHYCPICNVCYGRRTMTSNHISQCHPSEAPWALKNIHTMSHKVTNLKSNNPVKKSSQSDENDTSVPTLCDNITNNSSQESVQNNTDGSTKLISNTSSSKSKLIASKTTKKQKLKSKLKKRLKSKSSNKSSSVKITATKILNSPPKSVQNSPKSETVAPLKIDVTSNKETANVEISPDKIQSQDSVETFGAENVVEIPVDKQNEIFECSHCDDSYESSNLMLYHKLKEHPTFYKINIKSEIAEKVTRTRFFCAECQNHFPCANDCGFHIKKVHENIACKIEPKYLKFWLCTICHKTRSFKYFINELELLKHNIDHHNVDFNQCIQEKSINGTKVDEEKEKSKKIIVTAFICSECSKPFRSSCALSEHLTVNHPHIKYSIKKVEKRKMCIKKCKYVSCRTYFFHKSKLADHEKVCTYNEHRLYHKRIDFTKVGKEIIGNKIDTTNIQMDTKYFCRKYFKRLRCPKCPRGFLNKMQCRKHLATYHTANSFEGIKLEDMLLWSCKVCNTGYQVNNCHSNDAMIKHLFSSHNIIGTIDEHGYFHEKESLHETQLIDHSILQQAIESAGINDNDSNELIQNSNQLNDKEIQMEIIPPSIEIKDNSNVQTHLIEFDNSVADISIGNITETIENPNLNNTDIQSTIIKQLKTSPEKHKDNKNSSPSLEISLVKPKQTKPTENINKKIKSNKIKTNYKFYPLDVKEKIKSCNDSIFTKIMENRSYCKLCTESYTSMQNAKKHSLKKHGEYKQNNFRTEKIISWKCNICISTSRWGSGLLLRHVKDDKEMEEHFQTSHNLKGNIMQNGDFIQNGIKLLLSNIDEAKDIQNVALNNSLVITTCKIFNTEKKRRYYCPYCSENYTSFQNLEKHALKRHAEEKLNMKAVKIRYSKVWRCKVCKPSKVLHIVNSNASMLQHLKSDHNLNGTIDEACNFHKESSTLHTYTDHINLGKNVCAKETFRRYVCTVCSNHFEQKTNCVKHMESMHSQTCGTVRQDMLLWICFLCKSGKPVKNCKSNLDMENHVKVKHELIGSIDNNDDFIQSISIVNYTENESVTGVKNIENINTNELQLVEKDFEIEAVNLLNEFQNTSLNILILPENNDPIQEIQQEKFCFQNDIDPSKDIPEIMVDFDKIPTKSRVRFYCPECTLDFAAKVPTERHVQYDHGNKNYVSTCQRILEKTSHFYLCELCTYYSSLKHLPDQLSFKLHLKKYHLDKLKNNQTNNNAIRYNENLIAIQNIASEVNVNEVTHYGNNIVNTENVVEFIPEYSDSIVLLETRVIQEDNLVDMELINDHSNIIHLNETSQIIDGTNVMFVDDCNVVYKVINTNINENQIEQHFETSNNECNTEEEVHTNIDKVNLVETDAIEKISITLNTVTDNMNVINENAELLQENLAIKYICPLCPFINYEHITDVQTHIITKHADVQPPVLFVTKEVPYWACKVCREEGKPFRNIYSKSVFINHLQSYHNMYIEDVSENNINSEPSTSVEPANNSETKQSKTLTKKNTKNITSSSSKKITKVAVENTHKIPETPELVPESSHSKRRTSNWTCNICSKNFKDKYSLLDHKDVVHYNTELNINKKKKK